MPRPNPLSDEAIYELGRQHGAVNSEPTPNPSQIKSSPAGGLVERVADALDGGTESQARAAILAVADAMELHNFPAACWLRDEVQRNQQD
jgi:hypothetical protein